MSETEINNLGLFERYDALSYAMFTYVARAINLPSKPKPFTIPDIPKKGFEFKWTHDAIRAKIAEAYRK